jgi:hypothetical protein
MFSFCLTLDTEPDDLWANRPTLSFNHVERLFDFHRELCERGARPTYLTTSEMVEDLAACRVLGRILATGQAEIGAHFHSWTRTWPFAFPYLGNPPVHANAHQLGPELEERMLAYTCDALEKALRVRPVSFRGGRWSLNGASVRSLVNCGIRVDTTVTPGISWENLSQPLTSGPDFRDFPRTPFYLSGESLEPRTSGEVLELPVGASFIPDRDSVIRGGLVARVMRRIRKAFGRPAGLIWLRPTVMNRAETAACLKRLRADNVPVWVCMIHSSEIAPCTYFTTEEQLDAFRRRCLELVEDAIALGATGATLKEVCDNYARAS